MKVSVLTSVYNKGPWLARWFDCVCGQTFKDLEIVVVNNASTDNCAQIIADYAAKDNRIKVVTLDVNKGPTGGLNTAIKNTTGEYFTICDADDFIDKDYVQVLYDAIVETDADMSMCINDIVFPDGSTTHKAWPPKGRHIIEGDKAKLLPCQLLNEFSDKYFGFHMPEIGGEWNKMLKTSIIREHSVAFNESLWIWCDFDFYLQYLWHVKKVAYTTDAVYHFYQSENSITRAKTFNVSSLLFVVDALDSIEKQLQGRKTKELVNAALKFYYLRLYDVCFNLQYHKSVISQADYDRTYKRLFESEPVRLLFAAKDLSFLNSKEKIFLYLVKQGRLKEAIFFNRVYCALRRRVYKYVLRKKAV